MKKLVAWIGIALTLAGTQVFADPPTAMYLFPAGGQRGTSVKVHAGGLFLNKSCNFEILGQGVTGPGIVHRTATPFFEGPVLPLPESQRQEDYPLAMAAEIKIAADAIPGNRHVRLWTSQGVTLPLPFVVGHLPEIVEKEIDGDPIPQAVTLPLTINGRIYPRENVDVWKVQLKKGQALSAAVNASGIGSPLDARLEIRDGQGKLLLENRDGLRPDPTILFTAPSDGDYLVHITDVRGDGGPAFVYRLTLTSGSIVHSVYPLGGRRGTTSRFSVRGVGLRMEETAIAIPVMDSGVNTYQVENGPNGTTEICLDVDDLPEVLEAEEAGDPIRANFLTVPAIGNGRILKPGEIDSWTFSARAGESYEIDLRAHRLGSSLLGVLTAYDGAGKVLGTAEAGPNGDPTLRITATANGLIKVAVQDRFASRSGPTFAYRLRIERPEPGFDLQFALASLTLDRGKQVPLKITATRRGNVNGPIHLKLLGLPAGVTVAKEAIIPAGQASVDIPLKVDASATIESFALRVSGTAYHPLLPFTAMPLPITRTAKFNDSAIDHVRIAIALPTPFKIAGEYQLQLIPRGTTYSRKFRIDRNGFTGPIEIMLADKQARHLQGVTAGSIIVPPEKSEFEYAIQLPPWMETGRTCRVCVMGTGIVKEPDGKEHVVTYSSREQNDQIITVIEPERLSIKLDRETVRVIPGTEATFSVKVGRGEKLGGAIRIDAAIPQHFQGIEPAHLDIAPGAVEGTFRLRFSKEAKGPFNQPLLIKAVIMDGMLPVVAETRVELIPAK